MLRIDNVKFLLLIIPNTFDSNGELLEICGQNYLYPWHLSSVQGLSEEAPVVIPGYRESILYLGKKLL